MKDTPFLRWLQSDELEEFIDTYSGWGRCEWCPSRGKLSYIP